MCGLSSLGREDTLWRQTISASSRNVNTNSSINNPPGGVIRSIPSPRSFQQTSPIRDPKDYTKRIMSPGYRPSLDTRDILAEAERKLAEADQAALTVSKARVGSTNQRATTRDFKSTFAPEWADGHGDSSNIHRADMGWQKPLWSLQRLDWKGGDMRSRLGASY
jgi:hypothetical protein